MLRDDVVTKVKTALLSMQRFHWEQGVAAQALLELGDRDEVILLAKAALMRRAKDGRLAVMERNESVTDPACMGEPLLFAARATGEAELQEAADRLRDYLLYRAPKTRDGVLYHLDITHQVWVDAYYMAPPFLAAAGCIDEALKQIYGFKKYLWSSDKRLLSHVWDDDLNGLERKDFWGVGNGWAAAGIARVIRALPESRRGDKAALIGFEKEIIDGCISHQRQDGLFHNVLDDPSTFVETNAGQMLAYSIYRGVASGWLDRSYLPYADRARSAAERSVDRLGLVQGVCAAPTFDRAGVAPEGQAFFLLMEAAARDLNR